MSAPLNVEWLNQNSLRAYPFEEDMRLRPSADGAVMAGVRLPSSAVLDVLLSTGEDAQPRVYMSSFTLASTPGGMSATAVFADASDGTSLAVAACLQPGGVSWSAAPLSGTPDHEDVRGTVVFGDLERTGSLLPDGIYSFEAAESLLEARCVRPSLPCVSGLYVADASGSWGSRRLRGDVALVAGRNVRLDFDEEHNAIVVNADARYGFNDDCGCADEDARVQVRTINGISAKDVVIEGGDCVKVTASEGRIRIEDTCSKPCCGCAELAFLNQKTNMITTAIGRLDSFSQDLDARLGEFVRNVLLSDGNFMKYV